MRTRFNSLEDSLSSVALPEGFAPAALVSSTEEYDKMWKESVEDPAAFWGRIAEDFHWNTKPESVVSDANNFDVREGTISSKWFEGGTTNLCYNAVDRHVKAGNGDKVAFYWEGNDVGEESVMTYSDVLAAVCRLALVSALSCHLSARALPVVTSLSLRHLPNLISRDFVFSTLHLI